MNASKTKMQALHNPSYLQSSLSMILFFASWGIWWSFFQLWLTSPSNGLGLNGSQVGTVYSANSLATLIFMMLYGTLQDKLVIKRTLLIVSAVIATLIGPFFIWIYAPLLQHSFTLGLILGSVVLSAGFLAASGVLEAVTERFSRVFHFEYGQARAWGSFGYALVALLAGFLFVKNPNYNFWVGSFFGFLLLLNLLLWVPKAERSAAKEQQTNQSDASVPSLRDMLALLKIPALWIVIIFVMFSWTFYTVFDQQMFPSFFTHLFASSATGEKMYGTLNSIQVFCEALMMGVVPVIMRKIGVRNTLLLGVAVMCLRIGLCAVATDPLTVSCIKMFHALEVPLFILPIFRYFTLHFDTKLSATLYMISFQIAAQVGQVILSTPLGTLRDHFGDRPTFLIISAIVLLAGLFAAAFLKKDDQDVYGDAFVRTSSTH